MADPARARDAKHTYREYCAWPEGERWELIDGVAYDMSPAPAQKHQALSIELGRQIANFLQGKSCRVYIAPFDVLLPDSSDQDDDDVPTVVQPDIVVVCDKSRLSEMGCRGAPDWIVEILSPSTNVKDQREKLSLYERHGVKEYWVVHPSDKTVMAYVSGPAGGYGKPRVYGNDEKAEPVTLPGLSIDLKTVFERSEL
jgi:Uma2 family endonuclease